MFEYDGQPIDEVTLQSWADDAGIPIEDYKVKYNIKRIPEEGKTNATAKKAARVVAETPADTDLQLEDGSSELQGNQQGPSQFAEEQKKPIGFLPSYEEKNNIKVEPTNAVEVFKNTQEQLKDIKLSDFSNPRNLLAKAAQNDDFVTSFSQNVFDLEKDKIENFKTELSKKYDLSKADGVNNANKELNAFTTSMLKEAMDSSDGYRTRVNAYTDALVQKQIELINSAEIKAEKENEQQVKALADYVFRSVPFLPDSVKKGGLKLMYTVPQAIDLGMPITGALSKLDDAASLGKILQKIETQGGVPSKKGDGVFVTNISGGSDKYESNEAAIKDYQNKIQELYSEGLGKIVESQQYQEMIDKFGAPPEVWDEDGLTAKDFGEMFGTQAGQMVMSILPPLIYAQEVGGMLTEVLEGKGQEKFGEKWGTMSQEDKNKAYEEIVKSGEIDYTKMELAGGISASLDVFSNLFGASKIAKGVGGSVARNLVKRNVKGLMKASKGNLKEVLKAQLAEIPTEIMQESITGTTVGGELGTIGITGKEVLEVGTQAAITSGPLVAIGRGTKGTIRQARKLAGLEFKNKKEITNQIKQEVAAVEMLYENGSIDKAARDEQLTAIYEAESIARNSKYKNFETEAKEDMVDLEIQKKVLANKNEALKTEYTAENVFSAGQIAANEEEIQKLEEKRKSVLNKQITLNMGNKFRDYINNNSEKFNGFTYSSFETAEQAKDFLIRKGVDLNKENVQGLINGDNYAITLDGQKIIVDVKENLGKGLAGVGGNAVHHEGIHAILNSSDDSTVQSIVDGIKQFAKESGNKDLLDIINNSEARVLADYSNAKSREANEEFLASVSDFMRVQEVKKGDVQVTTALSKIGNRIAQALGKGNPESLDFSGLKDGAETIAFLRKYNSFNGNPLSNIKLPTPKKGSTEATLQPEEKEKAKKIRIFDFDDTLAKSNSQVLYTLPDGTTGKLNATEYAKRDKELKDKGATFDFSEFSKVIDGKKGPLFEVAQKINAARGNEDLFVLTARPADAAGPIQEFLKLAGLNFKKENIIGLGDGTAQAKADWVQGKVDEGYNDFYFADDAIKNVNAVKDVLSNADVKSKVQQAKASKIVQEVKFEDDSINEQFKAFAYDGKVNNAPESFHVTAAYQYEPLAQAVVNTLANKGIASGSAEQNNLIMGYLEDATNRQELVEQLVIPVGGNQASSLLGLAKTYNPEIGSFGGYAKGFLAARAIRQLENKMKASFIGSQKIDAPESRQVAAEDQKTETADTRSVFEKFNFKPSLKSKADGLVELGILNVENKLKGQNLSNAKKISARTKGLSDVYKKIAPDVKKVIGKGKEFDNFLDTNWENIGNAYVDNVAVSKGRGGGISPFSEGFSKKDVIDYFKGNDLIVGELNKNDKPLTKDQKTRAVSTRKTRSLPEAISRQIANESLKDYVKNNPEINNQFQKDYGFALASKVLKDLKSKDQIGFDNLSNALKQLDNDLLSNHEYNFEKTFKTLGIEDIFKQIYGGANGAKRLKKLIDDFEKEFSSMEKVEPTFEYLGKKYTLAGFITDKILSEIENDSYALQVEAITGRKLNLDWGDPAFISQVQASYSRIGKRMGKEWMDRFLSKGLKAPSKIGNGTLTVDENFNLVFSEEGKSTNRFGVFKNTEHYNTWADSQNFPNKPINAYPFRAASAKPYKDKKGKIVWSKEDRTEEGIKAIQLSGISDNKAFIDLIDAIKEEGIGIDETVGLLMSMNNNPLGLTRRSAILDFMPTKEFEGQYLLEHMTPALVVNLAALDYIHNKESNPSDFKKLMQTYRTAQIPKKYDDIVNEFYKSHMPFYFKPGDVSIVRYYNPEIGERFDLKLKTLSTGTVIDKTYYKDNSKQEKSQSESLAVFDLDDKTMASKVLDEDFNKMLERVKGIKAEARYSEDRANKLAGNKGKFKFFVPYSAEDYVGLIYPTLGKGKEGDRNLQWYKDNIINPFAVGIANFEKAKVESLEQWRDLKKQISKTPAKLNKEAVRGFTNEEALRVYLWNEQDVVPDTLAKKDVEALVKHVEDSKELAAFAENVKSIVGAGGYPAPGNNWLSGSLTIDLIDNINTGKRSEFLQQWQDNVDVVYSKDNMNKLKAIYGERYTEALENILYRMKTGRNRPSGATRLENQFMNWVNDSVGTVMFFNTRSALLQTISAVNFLNWSDNNPLMAAKAFANQPRFWKDFADLFNSDFLKSRRSGLKNDINADELAKSAATADNKVRAGLSAILKAGFLPTQIADSFAISIGGASFYRNRLNTYKKQGLSEEQAKEKAMLDFQETAEESQQSSRPDRVSMQQASSLGRVILAFANTPMQYTRLTKKAALDLVNGRGDWKTNMSKILYYGAVQNIIFTALQQAMFAMLFDDDEIDDEEQTEASAKIVNGIADTFLRGSGVGGAAVATMKNIIMEIIKQKESKRPDYTKAALKLTTLSPPIDTKIRKLMSAGRAFTYRQSLKDMNRLGVDIDNPAALATGQVLSAVANLPADRAILKMRNVKGALDTEHEAWQRIALGLGFSDWQLGIEKDKSKTDKTKAQIMKELKKSNPFEYKRRKAKERREKKKAKRLKKSPTKKLERGVAGRANNDGTIEIDPNLSPVEREKTIAHEKQHMKDMKAGKLNYDDDYVYWNGGKYERKNGKIKYKGKSYIEGHKDLPWEKKAYAAEPSTAEAKKRTKLYA